VNVGTFLTRAARQRPEVPAVRWGPTSLSYRQMADRALRLAAALGDRGVQRGDRIGILQQNRPELLETLFAGFLGGLVVVPINARLHPQEVGWILGHAGASALVHGEEFNDGLSGAELDERVLRVSIRPTRGEEDYEGMIASAEPLPGPAEVDAGDLAWLFYTSGTTGRPKGVMWSHRTVRLGAMSLLADVVDLRPEDVVLHAAPLTHGSGSVAVAAIARGATNVILDAASFDPAAMADLIELAGVTVVAFLAPTQIVRMVRELDPDRLRGSSLRAICYGGGPMFTEDLEEAVRRFGPIWVQVFGQGESPMTITVLRAEDHRRFLATGDPRLASAGVPRTDVEVRVADRDDRGLPPGEVGEIQVRGDIVMLGYWNDPLATEEALRGGWLHTGDLGAFDAFGYLSVLDRAKDMIVTGGQNVYPREVEDVILAHPGVSGAAVFGVPDDYWGEAVHAVVVPAPGAAPTERQIVEHCRSHLAGFKAPKTVEFVGALPTNAAGKVLKRELRDPHWVGYERMVSGGRRPPGGAGRRETLDVHVER
jgi:acyl-CoA synthetase (AMP-forming)/AMP-acid ligase II